MIGYYYLIRIFFGKLPRGKYVVRVQVAWQRAEGLLWQRKYVKLSAGLTAVLSDSVTSL